VLLEVVPGVQRQPPVLEVASLASRCVAGAGALMAERAWPRAPVVVRSVLPRAAVARLAWPRLVEVVATHALRRATARVLAGEQLRAPEAAREVSSLEVTVMPRAGSRTVARAWQRALATTALCAWRGLPLPVMAPLAQPRPKVLVMPATLRLAPTVSVAWRWPRAPALPRAELSRPRAAWAMALVLRRAPAMAARRGGWRGPSVRGLASRAGPRP
jgi:hypothetical protein